MRYNVKCGSCEEISEIQKKMNDPCPACPLCGHFHTYVYHCTPPNFQLKGDGWASKDISEDYRIENELSRGSK